MVQINRSYTFDARQAVEGQVVDSTYTETKSRILTTETATFGRFLTDDGNDRAKLVSAAGDFVIGCTRYSPYDAVNPEVDATTNEAGQTAAYQVGDSVSIVRDGPVWVYAMAAVSEGGLGYAVITAGENRGRVHPTSSASTTTKAVCEFQETTTAAGLVQAYIQRGL